jgi:hypothetical protein
MISVRVHMHTILYGGHVLAAAFCPHKSVDKWTLPHRKELRWIKEHCLPARSMQMLVGRGFGIHFNCAGL